MLQTTCRIWNTPVIFSSLPFQVSDRGEERAPEGAIIGWWLRRSGQVSVDVGNPRASIASLASAARTSRAGCRCSFFRRADDGDGEPAKFLNGPAFMGDSGAGSGDTDGADWDA